MYTTGIDVGGTNLMADILSEEYPTATFLKGDPELR